MQKVEQILGANWADDSEGKKCKEIGETFEKILDVTPILEDWKADVTAVSKTFT